MSEISSDILESYAYSLVAATVGRATIAWNTLSLAVFELFRLLSELDLDAAKATFFIVNSDRSQRDMTGALVEHRLRPLDARLAKKAKGLLAKADGLAGRRNDILHVVFIDESLPSKVRQFHERGHLKGKAGNDLMEAIHKAAIDCLDISIEIYRLTLEIQKLPKFQGQLLAEAVRQHIALRKGEEVANREEFGLLELPPTISESFEPSTS